ncbi:phosphoribosylamine--glycine ligase [Hyphomicrobiales bacterium]|nr:phosphoribosylamine--glycine ligase [Hyphomicrobiales bacterium]
MNILLIGSGGREHSIARALSESLLSKKIFCTPGNPGIEKYADSVVLDTSDHPKILNYCITNKINLVIIGPEIPLVEGLSDFLIKNNILVFGPKMLAAKLEGSKKFTKEICEKYNIPTAKFKSFNNSILAIDYLKKQIFPIVIKADGLAAGKGVIIAENLEEGLRAVEKNFSGAFNGAGNEIIIEEFLYGEEVSFFILADEDSFIELTSAQDHKRIGLEDTGPNTGGMGAYSPAPIMTDELRKKTIETIIEPTLLAMKDLDCPFTGILYAGLMITKEGPKLIEYNVRFGDPECQVILPRLKSDLLNLIINTCKNKLNETSVDWDDRYALTIVMTSDGYPNSYKTGYSITGLDLAEKNPNTIIFHAGTKRDGEKIITNGGRVINVTSFGNTVKEANLNAISAINLIEWENSYYRSDIGWREIKRENNE